MKSRAVFFFFAGFLAIHSLSGAPPERRFERLWEIFQDKREFAPFKSGKSDRALQEEFENLHTARTAVWALPEYEMAHHLVAEGLVRAPGCSAFSYNNTVSYYNASTVYLGDIQAIACEGPRSKDVPAFFRMLARENITHLVRLTGAYEGWSKKCHPYWEDRIVESEGKTYLQIPIEGGIHLVEVFHLDQWQDNRGVDPESLLALAVQVKQSLEAKKGRLAVHCSAGVGRTGTFLAALAILDTLDQGKELSIEEIVYRLSLQRVHSVAKPTQYLTLHRLAEACQR